MTALPLLPGIDMLGAATLLAGAAVFALLVALYAAATVRDPMARRMKALNRRRATLKAGIVAPAPRHRARLGATSAATDRMRALLSALRVLQDSQLRQAQIRLLRAGIRSRDAAVAVIFGRMALPILIGGTAAIGLYLLGWCPAWGPVKRYAVVALALVGSYKAPDLWVRSRIARRAAAVRRGLPDALDLLVICAEAGLTVEAAFHRVARELGRGYPELGDEFALTAIELGFLADRRGAFDNLALRVDLDSIRAVVTTLIQTERYGTPLAAALRALAGEFRHERMMRAEEKAARLPAVMTIPLILFILPVLFVVILGPAACSIADNMLK